MQAKLFCKTGPLAGTSYDVQGEVTIGKSPGNSIQLTPAIISGKHARIVFDSKKSAFFIEDLGSTNGTWVDGMRVKGKERLDRLNIISFADSFDFVFQIVGQGVVMKKDVAPSRSDPVQAAKTAQSGKKTTIDDGEAFVTLQKSPGQPAIPRNATIIDDGMVPAPAINPQPQQKKDIASGQQSPGAKTMMDDGGAFIPPLKPASPPLANERPKNATVFDDGSPIPQFEAPKGVQKTVAVTPMKFVLEVKSPAGTKAYDMKEGENTIGREASCDVFIEDSSMSRKHAVVVLKSGELTINDLGSKNGTFLGSEKVSTERKLRPGDDLQFGNVTARLSGKSIA